MKYSASKNQIKAIYSRVKKAAEIGDFSVYQRGHALLLVIEHGLDLSQAAEAIGKSHETIRLWVRDFYAKGVNFLKITFSRGRNAKLTKAQFRRLMQIVACPPYESGYDGGCWNAAMIADLIKRLFGVKYSTKYLPQLLKKIGLSYQKAKFAPAKADPEKRKEWLEKTWPSIFKKAKKQKAMILFGDEASFALWGSLSYTWAIKGQQPVVETNGNRKNLKVFGMIDYFSGKLFTQTVEGRLNGKSYISFLRKVLRESTGKIIVIQDGARYHTSKEVKGFASENNDRLCTYRLPPYSPDFNPIEQVWRKIKRGFTHNVFFEDYDELTATIKKALRKLKKRPEDILSLFGVYNPSKPKPIKA
jgi:transposase